MRKKTHEEYVSELADKNPNVEVVGEYVDAKTKILHKCNIDGYEWDVTPSNMLSGKGCPKCAGNNKKTHIQYIEEIKKINPNIEVVGKYINSQTKLLHRCLVDGYEWEATPSHIILGTGCPKCAGILNKTHSEYIKELYIINPNIEAIDEYINACTPILHKCKKHNVIWKAYPTNLLKGQGCCKCLREKIHIKNSMTNEQYVKKLQVINHNIISLEKYINSRTPILHKCLKDNYKWKASPNSILSGTGCPKCNESHGERQIGLWLDKKTIKYEKEKRFNDCKSKKTLPFDFYLPDYNIAIEYDGGQHFKPIKHFGGDKAFEYTVKHDQIKNEYCKNNDIPLLRIPYYKNVEEELNNFLFI